MFRIDKYLHVRYRKGGRQYPFLDCWGLVLWVFAHELGVTIPLSESVPKADENEQFEAAIKKQVTYREINRPEADKYYIACFYDAVGRVVHAGVIVNRKLLHTSIRGTRYELLSDAVFGHKWNTRIYQIL